MHQEEIGKDWTNLLHRTGPGQDRHIRGIKFHFYSEDQETQGGIMLYPKRTMPVCPGHNLQLLLTV